MCSSRGTSSPRLSPPPCGTPFLGSRAVHAPFESSPRTVSLTVFGRGTFMARLLAERYGGDTVAPWLIQSSPYGSRSTASFGTVSSSTWMCLGSDTLKGESQSCRMLCCAGCHREKWRFACHRIERKKNGPKGRFFLVLSTVATQVSPFPASLLSLWSETVINREEFCDHVM